MCRLLVGVLRFCCSRRAQPHIKFGSLNDKNVGQLRKLNLAVFPVKYNDKFYTDLSTSPTQEYTHIGSPSTAPPPPPTAPRPLPLPAATRSD